MNSSFPIEHIFTTQKINVNQLIPWSNQIITNRQLQNVATEVVNYFLQNGIYEIEITPQDFLQIHQGFQYFFMNIQFIQDIGIDRFLENTIQIFHIEQILKNKYRNLLLKNSNQMIPTPNSRIQNVNQQNIMQGGFYPKKTFFFILCIFLCLSSSMAIAQNVHSTTNTQIQNPTQNLSQIKNQFQKEVFNINQRLIQNKYNPSLRNQNKQQLIKLRNERKLQITQINMNLGNYKDVIIHYFYEYYQLAFIFLSGIFMDYRRGENIFKSIQKRFMFVAPNTMKKNILFLSFTEFISNLGEENQIDKYKKELAKCKEELQRCKQSLHSLIPNQQ
jgi:hypothetical protein